jgi:phosphoribosyl-ATP pyrophosphohydrolase
MVISPEARCWTIVASTADDLGLVVEYAQMSFVAFSVEVVVVAGRVKLKEVVLELEKERGF